MPGTKTIRYIGPHDRIHIPTIGKFAATDDIEVPADLAASLTAQDAFEAATKSKSKTAPAKGADTQESDD